MEVELLCGRWMDRLAPGMTVTLSCTERRRELEIFEPHMYLRFSREVEVIQPPGYAALTSFRFASY